MRDIKETGHYVRDKEAAEILLRPEPAVGPLNILVMPVIAAPYPKLDLGDSFLDLQSPTC